VIVDIKLRDGDDPVFISSLSSMIARPASDRDPHELYVTRVAKWFDQKWLRFSVLAAFDLMALPITTTQPSMPCGKLISRSHPSHRRNCPLQWLGSEHQTVGTTES
jgi:hypothetical protein